MLYSLHSCSPLTLTFRSANWRTAEIGVVTMAYRIFATLVLVLAVSTIVEAQNVNLGIGVNLVSPGPNTLTAADLMSKTSSSFVAHTVIGADGRARFSVYLPGSNSSTPLSPYAGYIISSPRTTSVSMGSTTPTTLSSYAVVLFNGTNSAVILSDTGVYEASAYAPAIANGYRPGSILRGQAADSKNIYAMSYINTTACTAYVDAFSIATSQPTTLTTAACWNFAKAKMQRDGTILTVGSTSYYGANVDYYNPRTQQIHRVATGPQYETIANPIVYGSRVFWVRGTPPHSQIYRYSTYPDTAALTAEPNGVYDFDVSPDGSYIAYTTSIDGSTRDIKIMSSDGGNVVTVTNNHVYDGSPAFLPDGSIIFITNRDDNYDIYHVDPDGKNPRAFYRAHAGAQYSLTVVKR